MSRCSKRNFASKEEAEEVIPMIQVLNDSKGKSKRNSGLHAYHCPVCESWHVGHQSKYKFMKRGLPVK